MSEMKFQTAVDIADFSRKTGYQKKNLFMGSCFTENIGNKMAALLYDVDINPFGILYNPVSVANGLEFLIKQRMVQEDELIQHENLWHSFYHHGRFSSPGTEETLKKINERIVSSSEFLKKTDFLFITFGTAWIYKYKKSGKIVSNCHKIPGNEFHRTRLTVDEIVKRYGILLSQLRQLNPEMNIVFTVSPIRHWKDGAVENQRSKATLILAVDQIIKNQEQTNCSYFPSYEIVMDELRDYRFYSGDMIHLSEVAVNYIWEKFENKLLDEESKKVALQVQKVNDAVNHKPFNKVTTENLKFLNQTLKKIEILSRNYPYLNLTAIWKNVVERINSIEDGTTI